MITFKQFLAEASGTLYRRVSDEVHKVLLAGKSVKNTKKMYSMAKDQDHLKAEFGKHTVSVQIADLKGVQIIPVRYDLAWFTQSKLHRQILLYVTARTEQEWLDEFDGDFEAADDEIESLFGDEGEVILIGLKSIDPKVFKVLS